LYSPFIDRLQFGNLIGISILAVIWLWGETINKKQNFYALSSLLILLVTHLFLGARAAQLGSLVSMALLALVALAQIIYKKLKGSISKTAVVVITTIFVLSITLLLPYLSYHFVEPVKVRYDQLRWEIDMVLNHDFKAASYEHFTSLRRVVSWQNLWELVKQHPIMGIGTGDYNAELDKIYANDSLHLSRNSHSQYLQIWATVGVWGLLAFLGSLIYWLYALSRQANRWLFSFGCAVLLFYSVVFLFDAVLLRQVDNMAFPLILSIIYTISYRQQKAKN
jgi:O-antigen ligase